MTKQAKERLDYYRSEAGGEHDLLTTRLNGLLTGQSFLVLAYTMTMTADPAHAKSFQEIFPPILAVAACLIAFRAIRGIHAAKYTMGLWREKTRTLLEAEDAAKEFTITRASHTNKDGTVTDDVHETSLKFATWTPVIFIILWIALVIAWWLSRSSLPRPWA